MVSSKTRRSRERKLRDAALREGDPPASTRTDVIATNVEHLSALQALLKSYAAKWLQEGQSRRLSLEMQETLRRFCWGFSIMLHGGIYGMLPMGRACDHFQLHYGYQEQGKRAVAATLCRISNVDGSNMFKFLPPDLEDLNKTHRTHGVLCHAAPVNIALALYEDYVRPLQLELATTLYDDRTISSAKAWASFIFRTAGGAPLTSRALNKCLTVSATRNLCDCFGVAYQCA